MNTTREYTDIHTSLPLHAVHSYSHFTPATCSLFTLHSRYMQRYFKNSVPFCDVIVCETVNLRDMSSEKRNLNAEVLVVVLQVFMTATHSHGSPFALVESWVCHLLFGSALAASDDHHAPAPAAPAPAASPVKTKEELSEGTRKRKSKKAE